MARRLSEYKKQLPDVQIADKVESFKDHRSDRVFNAQVVIVGSGAGGAAAATALAEEGWDVLILEEGPFVPTTEFTLDATTMIRRLYRDAGTSMIQGTPNIIFAEGRCVGGSTVLYGGMVWRTPEKVLHRWERENGIANISAKDMEPHFQRTETLLNATTQVEESIGEDSRLMAEGARRLGWSVKPNIRAQNHCIGTNNCMYGCPQGAKLTALNTTIPRAIRHGARLVANCRVDRVLTKFGRAAGVEGWFVDAMGRPSYRFQANAPIVILAAGARHTPAILMRSKIKSESGLLGHNLMTHPNTKVLGFYPEAIDAWKGVHQGYQIEEFQDEGILLALAMLPPGIIAMTVPAVGAKLGQVMARYSHMLEAGCLVDDSTTGRVTLGWGGQPVMHYNITNYDLYRLKRATGLLAEILFITGAKEVMTGFSNLPMLYSVDDISKLFDARVKAQHVELMTVHIMGTAQMGRDPARSVTNEWGMLHNVPNLFIADASVMPSSLGVNPAETIMAVAFRNMEHLVENRGQYLGGKPGIRKASAISEAPSPDSDGSKSSSSQEQPASKSIKAVRKKTGTAAK
jgi:choline dehydrogenase-like flavoprotein